MEFLFFGFIIWMVCGIASASISSSKGNGGCAGFALGFLFGPLGLLIAALMPASRSAVAVANNVSPGPMGTCPFCLSLIPMAARVCRFCQRGLYSAEAIAANAAHDERERVKPPQNAQSLKQISCAHEFEPQGPTEDRCWKCGLIAKDDAVKRTLSPQSTSLRRAQCGQPLHQRTSNDPASVRATVLAVCASCRSIDNPEP